MDLSRPKLRGGEFVVCVRRFYPVTLCHSDTGFAHKFLADLTVAPVVELSSGRPFTVLTGTDYNLNFSSNTDRPSIGTVVVAVVGVYPPGLGPPNF